MSNVGRVGRKGPYRKSLLFFFKSVNLGTLSVGPSVKEAVVTCLLADSAAEEAGLQIGDVVLSVNGTEVTSVEHAEAVHLAKKGRWASYCRQRSMEMLRAQYTGSSKVGRWWLERSLYPQDVVT